MSMKGLKDSKYCIASDFYWTVVLAVCERFTFKFTLIFKCSVEMCRLKEKLCSGKLLVPSDQWPIFVYAGQIFDHVDPWKGLFRSKIMVKVTMVMSLAHSYSCIPVYFCFSITFTTLLIHHHDLMCEPPHSLMHNTRLCFIRLASLS